MKIPNKAKRGIKKELKKQGIQTKTSTSGHASVSRSSIDRSSIPKKKVMYSFNEGDLVTTNPKDKDFSDTSSICLVLDYDEGEYLTVWRPTGAFSARASTVRIIQRA